MFEVITVEVKEIKKYWQFYWSDFGGYVQGEAKVSLQLLIWK